MKKVAILSVLKPINDPRMYEKIGKSLASTNQFEVHIVGYQSAIPITNLPIRFYPLFSFRRLSLSRLTSSWRIGRFLLKVKPEIVISNTHENLIVSTLYKILFGGRLIYDIRENYFRNIWFQENYPPPLRQLLACYTRFKEYICHPFINHYLLAERGYLKEMHFTAKKSTIIENKYQPDETVLPVHRGIKIKEPFNIIYSGTIAKEYGIIEAIHLADELIKNYKITLYIVGYSPNNQILNNIKVLLQGKPHIQLIGGASPVPHKAILDYIKHCNIAITPYQLNKSFQNCIPTKFYEYIYHQIPILIPDHNPLWNNLIEAYGAGFTIDFYHLNPDSLIHKIKNTIFYGNKIDYKEILWNNEELKLLKLFFSLT